ncbi:type IV secretory system conjugative DNA transfer family protein [Xanthobacter sp. V2C-8]|uniref:type IV secretory system conjugative DNA transfer family protein n=1 Tax=Xanthobacter albus TaxID=3119929 RepID=UPI003728F618
MTTALMGALPLPPIVWFAITVGGALAAVLIVAAVGFALFYRPPPPRSHGSARWAKDGEIKGYYSGTGPVIGRDGRGRLLRAGGDAPLVTIAPTRAGKGAGQIVPTLLVEKTSAVVIDPKGEACRATGQRREEFGPVYVVDPFGIAGAPTCGYNPIGELAASPTIVEDAFRLAEALAPVEEGGHPHFDPVARTLLRAIILYVATELPPDRQNLLSVREILNLPAKLLRERLEEMATHELDAVAGPARQHLGRDDRESAGVLSTCGRHTEWLDSPLVAAVVAKSDFQFRRLKEDVGTVFIVLPPDQISVFSRWLRLLTTCVVSEFTQSPGAGGKGPCLFVVDEAAALGRIDALENSNAVMAGLGLRLWGFWQDLGQLQAVYGKKADSFLANAGTQIFLSVADGTTAEKVSRALGNETVVIGSRPHTTRVGRPLLSPDQVRLEKNLIVFGRGLKPVRATAVRWFSDKHFKNLGHNERSPS